MRNKSSINSTGKVIPNAEIPATENIFIKKMPFRQKEIFLLSLNERLTNEQIAVQLNISKKTVENYIGRAKTSLKNFLSKEHILNFIFFCVFIK